MQVAFGRQAEDESANNSHLISKYLRGQVGVLCTDLTESELKAFIAQHQAPDFAKAGAKASYTVFLAKGTETLSHLGHGMETQLR
mmetsp:Transcript_16337/g.15680  ORF Transcript_16337/g.15680 Transcript_16337/m.15680 type:complete len:85 (-) Transcript_16337:286-540(-)